MFALKSSLEQDVAKLPYSEFIGSLQGIGEIETLGLCSDGVNNVYAIHVDSKAKHNVVITSGTHGQHEWTAPYWNRTFFKYLVNPETSFNPELFNKLRYAFNWHWIPVVNPFGYVNGPSTWMSKDFPETRYNANGVDINRNFPVNWDSIAYEPKGTEPFSEIESQYIRDLVLAYKPVVELDWHTYGAPGNLTSSNERMFEVDLLTQDFLKTFKFGTGETTRFGNPKENLSMINNWAATQVSSLGIPCFASTPEISYEYTFEKQMEQGVFYNFAYFLHIDAFIKNKSLVNHKVG